LPAGADYLSGALHDALRDGERGMRLDVALQMDPIGPINIDGDSTFRIGLEAEARGHRLFYYTPDRLAWREGRVLATGWPLTLRREKGNHYTLGAETTVDLADFDVVWLRQDPPFDMGYITTTHILDHLAPGTLVVNDPFWVRNFPEKLLVLRFPGLTPATCIARSLATLRDFRAEHGEIILKPLYGNGGAGIFRLDRDDRNLASLWELFTSMSREPLIAQKYLPAVAKGDKRVILVDGEPVGAINRVPLPGETRSNLHAGGRPEPALLDDRDREICAAIGPLLREKGQIFVGIDVIGGFLTEINVTSPTGIQELERFTGINAARAMWEAIERRRAG
jgi:glutathione synthase